MKLALPNGKVIQARGLGPFIPYHDHEEPDWGLYLDKQWRERELRWPHDLIDWPDMRPPRDDKELCEAIARAWEHIVSDEIVEIACDGGTGRTGTVIACIAILAGVPVDDSVAWVKNNYSDYAVENQGTFIARFAEWAKANGLC